MQWDLKTFYTHLSTMVYLSLLTPSQSIASASNIGPCKALPGSAGCSDLQYYRLYNNQCKGFLKVQGAVSSNPIGCKKINGGNDTAAAGCGINTAIGTQPAFTTNYIRNATLLGPKNYLVIPPGLPQNNQGRHLLSTEVSASPLASYTNVTGQLCSANLRRQSHARFSCCTA